MIEPPSVILYHTLNDNSLRKGVLSVKRLVNTAQTYYRYSFIIVAAVGLPLVLLAASPLLFLTGSLEELDLIWVFPAILLPELPLLGFAVYYLAQYLYYRRVELDEIQEVFLNRTSTRGATRLVGFRVIVTIDGREREMVTKRVFTAASFGVNLIDDYSGRTALAGYDRNRGELIVLAN